MVSGILMMELGRAMRREKDWSLLVWIVCHQQDIFLFHACILRKKQLSDAVVTQYKVVG